MTAHTDANVQPQGDPWDGNEPDWSPATALPTDDQVDLAANPLRPFLLAMASDLTAGLATLNWQPRNSHVQGEVAAVKRCMARALEHSYGLEYREAFRRVEAAAVVQVGSRKIDDAGYERTKYGVYERTVAMILDAEWEPGNEWPAS